MTRKIEVVDYNPQWKKEFHTEAKKIQKILGKNCVAVHHIGSTAVKGLKAKPIIDILPVVKDITLADAHSAEFEALGYEWKGEFGISGRRFLAKGGDDRTYHVHIFEEQNKKEVERHLAVRDYLSCNPRVAAEYGELKTKLAREFAYDNEGYCNGKDAFVKKMEQDALEWKKKQDFLGRCISIGIGLGITFGCAFGITISNLATGVSLGMCLGLCAGAAAGCSRNKK